MISNDFNVPCASSIFIPVQAASSSRRPRCFGVVVRAVTSDPCDQALGSSLVVGTAQHF